MTSRYQRLSSELLARRRPTGDWNGLLASSAISTATAAIALYELDHVRHAQPIAAACQWLADTQLDNGAWGDTPESPPNLTASLLAGAALMRTKTNPAAADKAQKYLTTILGDFSPAAIRAAILKKYGKDLTFAVPILALCTATGLLNDCDYPWQKMPQLPFELTLLRACFVLASGAATPAALMAIGIARNQARPGLVISFRRRLIPAVLLDSSRSRSQRILKPPLTAFCVICLAAANHRDHQVAREGERFCYNRPARWLLAD